MTPGEQETRAKFLADSKEKELQYRKILEETMLGPPGIISTENFFDEIILKDLKDLD